MAIPSINEITQFLNQYDVKKVADYSKDLSKLFLMLKTQTERGVIEIATKMRANGLTTAIAIRMSNGAWDILVDRDEIQTAMKNTPR